MVFGIEKKCFAQHCSTLHMFAQRCMRLHLLAALPLGKVLSVPASYHCRTMFGSWFAKSERGTKQVRTGCQPDICCSYSCIDTHINFFCKNSCYRVSMLAKTKHSAYFSFRILTKLLTWKNTNNSPNHLFHLMNRCMISRTYCCTFTSANGRLLPGEKTALFLF